MGRRDLAGVDLFKSNSVRHRLNVIDVLDSRALKLFEHINKFSALAEYSFGKAGYLHRLAFKIMSHSLRSF